VRADGSKNDRRTFGAWDMIANTAKDRGADFLVVWDEAHRGSGSTETDRKTIAGTIANGGQRNVGGQQSATPVVLGISATPERFFAAMSAAGRTMRTVDVPPADVRKSGLLKDRILIKHIAEAQSADNTMLALAVADLKASDQAWQCHHAATGDRLVEPLMIVQVEPKVTSGRLAEILATIESAWPELSDYAVAHSFGDPHGPLQVGDRSVRYLPPEAISGDDRARVVLFKSALTTGWDCPRAEVLVSFQGKDSYTEIAQLIGRLVRTPLAQRIDEGDDRLNEVAAYLPGFRTEHVTNVVKSLTQDETVEVEVLIEPVYCVRNSAVPAVVFERLDTLPSYMRAKTTFTTRTAQLMRLAAALNEHGLVPGASAKARQWMVNQIRAADDMRRDEIDAKVADNLELSVGTTVVGMGEAISTTTVTADAATAERDLDAYYVRAQRLLPDGSAAWYWNHLCDRGMDEVEAGVRVAALAALGFKDAVEKVAVEQIDTWRQAHAGAVARMPRSVRDLIEPLWYTGSASMLPTTVVARTTYPAPTEKVVGGESKSVDTYPDHLYVIPEGKPKAGRFPVDTSKSSWEQMVLTIELEMSNTLLGWYRNPSSGRYALAVPYEFGAKTQLMHPDFLFFHQDGDDVVLDIIDPHRHDANDAAPKWAALAKYAAEHPDGLRRVLAVIRNTHGALRALDLRKDGIAEKVARATNKDLMEHLFASEGMNY
jgi:type III restriction enzyme